jgi:hypothetical protein
LQIPLKEGIGSEREADFMDNFIRCFLSSNRIAALKILPDLYPSLVGALEGAEL